MGALFFLPKLPPFLCFCRWNFIVFSFIMRLIYSNCSYFVTILIINMFFYQHIFFVYSFSFYFIIGKAFHKLSMLQTFSISFHTLDESLYVKSLKLSIFHSFFPTFSLQQTTIIIIVLPITILLP